MGFLKPALVLVNFLSRVFFKLSYYFLLVFVGFYFLYVWVLKFCGLFESYGVVFSVIAFYRFVAFFRILNEI